MNKIKLGLLLIISLSNNVWADQTIDGAQEFLAQALPNKNYVSGHQKWITANLKDGNSRVRLLGSESLAKRVAFAIEFLRLQCDATSKTGF